MKTSDEARPPAARERRLAALLMAPALGAVLVVALFPLAWTVWESLHGHDLRMPWLGRPFVGLANYASLVGDRRFWEAFGHTALFVIITVTLELALGLALALGLDSLRRGRGTARVVLLLPWAVPTVVAALVWRFMFEGRTGLASSLLIDAGLIDEPVAWLVGERTAWIPLVLADVWKTTPFVALLLLAGLQGIPHDLHEAARLDGAGRWRRFVAITLPLLAPAILVAGLFRTLDALRVFDLVYVLTNGGPGTATESISLYTFDQLLQNLRFGLGSAAAVATFTAAFAVALVWIRLSGTRILEMPR
ncbi:MAG: carbohydrate ABC transporter permease [Gemmatimonadales bacterium]